MAKGSAASCSTFAEDDRSGRRTPGQVSYTVYAIA
jgi:hypothetical protein